jgi:hypothetical protein
MLPPGSQANGGSTSIEADRSGAAHEDEQEAADDRQVRFFG